MITRIFALVLGLAALFVGISTIRKARQMRSFRSVRAKVLARDLAVVSSRREGVWGRGGPYAPRLRYRYTVDGTDFESDTMSYVVRGLRKSAAEAALAKYGDEVEVWVNPQSPNESYVIRHSGGVGYLVMTIGVVITLGALLSILVP